MSQPPVMCDSFSDFPCLEKHIWALGGCVLMAGVPISSRGWLAESLGYLSSTSWQFLRGRNTIHLYPVHTDTLHVFAERPPRSGLPLWCILLGLDPKLRPSKLNSGQSPMAEEVGWGRDQWLTFNLCPHPRTTVWTATGLLHAL